MNKNRGKETLTRNDIIRRFVLQNALQFAGRANLNAVLGMILKILPEERTAIPQLRQELEKMIDEVAAWPAEKVHTEYQDLSREIKDTVPAPTAELVGPLKPLPNAQKGKVVLRIAPSPSGPLHIGHAYGVCLNYAYAQMYQGKLLLRIEDTNPENIYPPAYQLIEEDAQWLTGNGIAQVIVQSSRLGIYYDAAEILVAKEKAYVCICDNDAWREEKKKGNSCPCRELPLKEQQQRYAKMFGEYAEGEAVLRLKTDLQHKNPAMRDFALMRIVEHVHPKTGKEQRIWPLMVFAVAIDDHELAVTHVLNGKDHTDNAIKESLIMEYLGWKPPEYRHWGRINFEGLELSTSKTRLAIEQGQYEGWEDVRLPFLRALRQRGYQPEAFRKFAVEIGLSLTDKTVAQEEFWKMINAFNREIIEPQANRYFFVADPVKVKITGAPKKEVEIPLHPDAPERGKRHLLAEDLVYIASEDYKHLAEGYVHRLMDWCNFQVMGKKFVWVPGTHETYRNSTDRGKIIHWLPVKNAEPAEVVLPTAQVLKGVAEQNLIQVPEGEIIQLERFAFCRMAKREKHLIRFWYLHR